MCVIYNVKNWDQEATTKLRILSPTVYVYIQHIYMSSSVFSPLGPDLVGHVQVESPL